MVEYFTVVAIWITCMFVEEPQCGIPMRTWVLNYLFFRLFKLVHNAIGIMLLLNETPIYYKPWAKMVVFTVFEQFEFWWMVFGEYLFFFSPSNKCKSTTTFWASDRSTIVMAKEQQLQLGQNFLYMVMLVLCMIGFLVIINGIMVFKEII